MLGFVVRSRNEEQHMGFALQSIFDKFGNNINVVVVDNESSDNTLKIVQTFPKKFFNIRILNIKNQDYTPGYSLNLGISELKQLGCDLAGIISAHCEITNANLQLIQQHFEDPMCFALIGKQVPIKQGKRINPRYIWSNFNHKTITKNIKEETLVDEERYFFHNAFSFLRIDHWNNLKFDEDLAGKEDRYWAKDQIDLGRYFVFDPSLECRHFWTEKGATWQA